MEFKSTTKNSYTYEIYTKDPITGQGGWYIKFYNVFAETKKEANALLNSIPLFDCVIDFLDEKPMSSLDVKSYADGADFRELEISASGGYLIY